MDIPGIFKKSLILIKNNLIIVIPTLVISMLMSIMSFLLVGGGAATVAVIEEGAMDTPSTMTDGLLSLAFLVAVISMALGTISQGITISMAEEAVDTGRSSIKNGVSAALARAGQLLIAALLLSVLVTLGIMLFFLPGIIIAFVLMFTFFGVMVGNLTAIESMKKSFDIVKNNPGNTVILFLSIVLTGILFVMVTSVFSVIPFLGQIIGAALMGLFWGYVSIVLVMAYKELATQNF
ncbi:MAG: hypothetical protein VST72_05625 [Nitrospirota bacterium]|nr:hypothetical protein [Nitrospirota bacterium]